MSSIKRLLKEYKDYQKKDAFKDTRILELSPSSTNYDDQDSLLYWTAVISGEPGTPYERGIFTIDIHIPEEYPLAPPKMTFLTRICHPNIHFQTGEICLDVLKNEWSPAWTLKSVCIGICVLLSSPEPDSPLNCDAANILRAKDFRAYNSLVRMYTALYAIQ